MNRKAPNDNSSLSTEFQPYHLGKNQVSKLFLEYLLPVFSINYKEGTELATYYKDIFKGKSIIYVEQPELEERLWNEVITPSKDSTKYLVGSTGVGKTTLIRNVFQIFDRKPVITKGNLIIYHSFYNMTPSTSNEKTFDIEEGIINTVESACTHLSGYKSKINRLMSYKKTNFYEDFLDFIVDNNSNLDSSIEDSSEFVESLTEENMYAKALDSIKAKDTLDYEMSLLKYYVKQYNSKSKEPLKNIVFILDDIESQPMYYQDHLLELVWRIKKCMGHQKEKSHRVSPHVKMLVALRNFSFRIQQNIHVQIDEGRREIPLNDIILKDSVPPISAIIKKRTDYILNHEEIIAGINNKTKWLNAIKSLNIILTRMYGQYDNMLLNLTHDNLFYSMILAMRIITNEKHLGKYELFLDEEKSAFELNPNVYKLRNPSNDSTVPGNDEVFKSLVYGEFKIYRSMGDYYLTNILNNKGIKGKESYLVELWGPYIIKYMLTKKIVVNRGVLDSFEPADMIIDNILSVFNWADNEDKKHNLRALKNIMGRYYVSGVLRESILKPRTDMEILKSSDRKYTDNIQVFLSTRGKQLYNMLSSNSLLLEAYRDDIETSLSQNDVPSLDLPHSACLKYCIQYINTIRLKELELLYLIKNGNDYVKNFGNETLTVHMLTGISETIKTYYTNDTVEKLELVNAYNDVVYRENENLKEVNSFLGIALKLAASV